MTKPREATARGLKPHYKVRVALPGSVLHLASWSEPRFRPKLNVPYIEAEIQADWILDPDYGDTIGYVDWDQVIAVTWRLAR
jgi:hypothetical protein